MALPRSAAVVGYDLLLRAIFENPVTQAPFDPDEIISVKIYDTDGVTLLQTIVGDDIDHVGLGSYEVISAAENYPVGGVYFDVWRYVVNPGDDPIEFSLETVVTAAPPSPADRDATIHVHDTSVEGQIYRLGGVSMLISDPDGIALQQEVTDDLGRAFFLLGEGSYISTISDPPKVFDANNASIVVTDPNEAEVPQQANVFYMEGASFVPSFDPVVLFGGENLCAMTLVLADFQGQPIRNREVYLRYISGPQIKTSDGGDIVGILGTNLTFITNSVGRIDADGSGTFTLLRGMTVEVVIEGTGVTRRVVVPDEATANLMALVNVAQDVFDIIQVAPEALMRDA